MILNLKTSLAPKEFTIQKERQRLYVKAEVKCLLGMWEQIRTDKEQIKLRINKQFFRNSFQK